MKPTRATQPYRRGARQPGAPLTNMLRGRSAGGWNPQDIVRANMLTGKGRRPVRPPRPKRPSR